GFALPPTEIEGYPNGFGLATADVNADGNLDVITTTRKGFKPGTAHVAVLLGDGKGAFTQSEFLPVTSNPTSIMVTDLDANGKLDFVVGGALPENTQGNF